MSRATIAFGIVGLRAAQAVAQYQVDAWTTEHGPPQNIVRAPCILAATAIYG